MVGYFHFFSLCCALISAAYQCCISMFYNISFLLFCGSFTLAVFIFGNVFLILIGKLSFVLFSSHIGSGKVSKPLGLENLSFFFDFGVLFLVFSIIKSGAGVT